MTNLAATYGPAVAALVDAWLADIDAEPLPPPPSLADLDGDHR